MKGVRFFVQDACCGDFGGRWRVLDSRLTFAVSNEAPSVLNENASKNVCALSEPVLSRLRTVGDNECNRDVSAPG